MGSMRMFLGRMNCQPGRENPFDLRLLNRMKGREERLLLAGTKCSNE